MYYPTPGIRLLQTAVHFEALSMFLQRSYDAALIIQKVKLMIA